MQLNLGVNSEEILSTVAVLEKGTGTNIIRYEALPISWRAHTKSDPCLCAENGYRLDWRGEMTLRTRIGDLTADVALGVVLSL